MPFPETDRFFTPQNQVVDLVDAHFGRLDLAVVPRPYKPTLKGIIVARSLIALSSDPGSGVKFVDADKTPSASCPDRPTFGLVGVIGPEYLLERAHDVPGPSSMLWDRGTLEEVVRFNAAAEGLKPVIESLYQLQ